MLWHGRHDCKYSLKLKTNISKNRMIYSLGLHKMNSYGKTACLKLILTSCEYSWKSYLSRQTSAEYIDRSKICDEIMNKIHCNSSRLYLLEKGLYSYRWYMEFLCNRGDSSISAHWRMGNCYFPICYRSIEYVDCIACRGAIYSLKKSILGMIL